MTRGIKLHSPRSQALADASWLSETSELVPGWRSVNDRSPTTTPCSSTAFPINPPQVLLKPLSLLPRLALQPVSNRLRAPNTLIIAVACWVFMKIFDLCIWGSMDLLARFCCKDFMVVSPGLNDQDPPSVRQRTNPLNLYQGLLSSSRSSSPPSSSPSPSSSLITLRAPPSSSSSPPSSPSSNARYFLFAFFLLLAFLFLFPSSFIAIRLSGPFSTTSSFSASKRRAIFRF